MKEAEAGEIEINQVCSPGPIGRGKGGKGEGARNSKR